MCGVYVGVCMGVRRCVGVGLGVFGSVSMHVNTHECAWVLVGMCGMNFQNTLWRLES